jgi:hypothetical protein
MSKKEDYSKQKFLIAADLRLSLSYFFSTFAMYIHSSFLVLLRSLPPSFLPSLPPLRLGQLLHFRVTGIPQLLICFQQVLHSLVASYVLADQEDEIAGLDVALGEGGDFVGLEGREAREGGREGGREGECG